MFYIIGIIVEFIIGVFVVGWEKMDMFGMIIILLVIVIGGGFIWDMLFGYYLFGWVKYFEYFVIVVVVFIFMMFIVWFLGYFCMIFLVLDVFGLIVFFIIGV